jgi:hypothetical protein
MIFGRYIETPSSPPPAPPAGAVDAAAVKMTNAK